MKADERAERLSKELDGYSDRIGALWDSLPDVPYGQRALTPEQHVQWLEGKSVSDPLWAQALPLVKGLPGGQASGKAELQRYNRARKRGV